MTISPSSTPIYDDVEELRRKLHEAQQVADERARALGLILNAIPQSVFWKDRDLVYRACNEHFARDAGVPVEEVAGKTDYDMRWRERADWIRSDDRRVMEADTPEHAVEVPFEAGDGSVSWLRTSKIPLHDDGGSVVGLLGMAEDVTAQKLTELERLQLQEEVIRMQAVALEEISTPLIPISDEVVIMPLVGAVDSRRAQQVLETLLAGVTASRARFAILDITGVAVVDTQVANGFVRAAQAAQLVGAKVMLTGIRPEVAQTLVGLGADLSGITTHSTLQSGIAYALSRA